MFRTKTIPLPQFQEEATIIVSSLSPYEPIHSLSFEEMHEIKYKQLKTDLNKVLSPKKQILNENNIKIKTKYKKKVINKNNEIEPTLYIPPITKEFSLSSKVKSISPSELVLLREQHAKRMNQVELHATSLPSLSR